MKTSITVVLDRSGSMNAVRDDAIGGFNRFLDDQRRDADGTTLTLTRFDHEYEIVCVDRPVDDVEPLDATTYVPRGSTALNDAIGRTIHELAARIDAAPAGQRPDQVLFVILTDGMENASREFTNRDVRDLIARYEAKHGWTFVYLAADVDAFAEAAARGIAPDRAYAFVKEGGGTADAFDALSIRAREYKRGRAFTFDADGEEDRDSV